MVNKFEIDMKQVLRNSTATVKSGEDAGKLVLARNLDCMKEWTDDEISEIFNDEGHLKAVRMKGKPRLATAKTPFSRCNLVKSTRYHTIAALRSIIKEKLHDSELKMPSNAELKKMARDLVSEENIRHAFEESFIVYNPYHIY